MLSYQSIIQVLFCYRFSDFNRAINFFLNSGSLPSPYLYGFLLQYCRCRITNNHCCQRTEVQQAGQYTVDRNHNCKLYQSSRHDRIEVVTKHDYKTSCCKYQRTENCSHHDRYTDTNCFSGFFLFANNGFARAGRTPQRIAATVINGFTA